MTRGLSYDAVGATRVSDPDWGPTPARFRSYESTTRLGRGEQVWAAASAAARRRSLRTAA